MQRSTRFATNLFIVWVGHFICDLMIGFFSIYKTIAELDLAKAGLIAGFGALLGESMQLVFGPLSDQGKRKHLLLGSLILLSGTAFLPFAESYALCFVLFAMTSVGSGMFHPTAAGLAGSLSTQKKGLIVGLFASGGAFGMAASHFMFSTAYNQLSGNTVIFALPVLGLAVFTFFSQVSETDPASRKPRPRVREIFQFFKRDDMRILYFTVLFNQIVFWGTVFILPDFLVARHYESWLCFGGGHMAFLLGGGLMMIPAGYLADHYGARKIITVATLTGIASYSLFLYKIFLYPWPVAALLFCMGASVGVIAPTGLAFGTQLMPDRPGMASAFLLGLVWCVAECVGPISVGLMADSFQVSPYAKALATLSCLNLVVVYLAWRLPQPSHATEVQAELT